MVSGDCIAPLHHNQIELDADAIVESLPCDYWHNQIESDSDDATTHLDASALTHCEESPFPL